MAVRVETHAEPIPGYRLIERLGGGGFGEVWKAEAPGGILKAIKFVYGNLQTASADGPRAEQELKALNRIKTVRHPYILSLERYDVIEGQLLIVMELADQNLWDRFRECRSQGQPGIPREELLRYMEDTAEGLDLMNIEYQLQHLDIKPQNLFLVHNHAKVADFGLVKDLEGMMASVTGGVTPVYAAPETFDGWISRFCDQYSLAIVYQEILTAQRPFCGTNVRQLILQHLQATPNLDSLPPSDRPHIERALSKNPEARFPSCRELVRALRGSKEDAPVIPVAATIAPAEASTPAHMPVADARPEPLEAAQSPTPGSLEDDEKTDQKAPPHPLAPQPAGETQWIRVHEAMEQTPAEGLVPPNAREELEGTGALFPALVIGLGQLGLQVLKGLREGVGLRFGGVDGLPNLRLLYLDTDPDAARLVDDDNPRRALSPNEVLIARLNRPSYYLRSQSRDRLHSWLNFKLLYRIPRNLLTTGMRALGRLAFVDNYRTISRRLQSDLEACVNIEDLEKAARQTGLGLRTSRPRVYIVAGLSGGTGGGMFLDTAYVARHLLRHMGYSNQEIVGIFLLPAVDRHPNGVMGLGNAFAALTELNHFSAQETRFTVRYDDLDKPLSDAEPPYTRCIFLSLPVGQEGSSVGGPTDLASEFLIRDMTSSLGRVADEYRGFVSSNAATTSGPSCQTVGLYKISCPRTALLRVIGRDLCRQIVKRWMTKDAKALREKVKASVAAFFKEQSVDGEYLMGQMHAASARLLGQHPETHFTLLTEPLTGWAAKVKDLNTAQPAGILQKLDELVGKPGALAEPLAAGSEMVIADWSKRLAGYATELIERPEFRLAGAEEAIRLMVVALDEQVHLYEPLYKDLHGRAAEARARIDALIAGIKATAPGTLKRGAPILNNLVELLNAYPKWQYQALILHQAIEAFVSVRGYLSEQLREFNFCRSRLADLLHGLEEPVLAPSGTLQPLGRELYPAGCRTFDDAVKQLLDNISSQQVGEFDSRVQKVIGQQFTGLMHVCLTPANLIKKLQAVMEQEAEGFLQEFISSASIADLYLGSTARVEETLQDLAEMYRAAAPGLNASRLGLHSEVCIVASPPGPASKRFNDLLHQAVPQAEIEPVPNDDEILIYREVPNIALGELDQLGPLGYDAYRQLSTIEHFTPHSRLDITEWRAAAKTQKS
jgi:hypothetical protein